MSPIRQSYLMGDGLLLPDSGVWANKYVGIPYSLHGESLTGVDCWGLARLVYEKELGITLDDPNNLDDCYVPILEYEAMRARSVTRWLEIPKGREEAFDIAEIGIMKNKKMCIHIGIVVRPHLLLEAIPVSNVVTVTYGVTRNLGIRRFWRYQS